MTDGRHSSPSTTATRGSTMTHAFWGAEYSDWRIRQAIDESGYDNYLCQSDDEVLQITADLITDGAVLGWYQGRSE